MNNKFLWNKIFEKTTSDVEHRIHSTISSYMTQEEINKMVKEATSDASNTLVKYLERKMFTILGTSRDRQNGFNKRLYNLWQRPLNLLKLLLIISEEFGTYHNAKLRPERAKEQDFVFDVLIRLHARSCLVGGEIFTLLCNGYASGADARWRSLYEIVVTSEFIAKHGSITAEKYLLHIAARKYDAMIQYNKFSRMLGTKPFSEQELKEAEEIKNQLGKKYGENFSKQYGWAAEELHKNKPTFRDIEKDVEFEHWQPYYKMASDEIHSNANGLLFNLGLINGSNEEIMLAGPSNAGIEEAGIKTSISISQINSLLGTKYPTYLSITIAKTILKLSDETQRSFLQVSRNINNVPHFTS